MNDGEMAVTLLVATIGSIVALMMVVATVLSVY